MKDNTIEIVDLTEQDCTAEVNRAMVRFHLVTEQIRAGTYVRRETPELDAALEEAFEHYFATGEFPDDEE